MSANEIPRATCAFKLLSFNCGGSDELVSSSAALSRRRYKSENSAEPYSPSLGLTALLQCWVCAARTLRTELHQGKLQIGKSAVARFS
jgi:hypothetical protein